MEAKKAGIDNIVAFQKGEHDNSGFVEGYIEHINRRVVLESIVYVPQTREIE